jgi:hypothetical protein
MGNQSGPSVFAEQCAYWHLLTALNKPQDPQVLAVRGFLARDPAAGLDAGGFAPGYLLDGSPDLEPGATGAYALVFRDARGAQLAREGFNVTFASSEGDPVHLVDFGFLVELPRGAARLELTGPSGVMASQDIPANPPTVRITAPGEGARVGLGQFEVAWDANAPPGANLTATLQVSDDDGATWQTVAADTTSRNATVPREFLRPGVMYTLRVLVSDGVLSGSADSHFGTPLPEGPPAKGLPAADAALLAAAFVVAAGIAARRRRKA